MTFDDYLTSKDITAAEAARQLAISRFHATKLRNLSTTPSLELSVRIIEWSGGLVQAADLLPPSP